MTKFCQIVLPDFKEVEELLQISKDKQISNFGPLYWVFKKELEKYLGLDENHELTIVSSGHVALMAGYFALETRSAAIPSYTFFSTLQAAKLQRIKTKIIDVDLISGIPSFASLAKEQEDFDTLVLVCPLSVIPPNIEEYIEWCKVHQKKILIDGAATFGSPGKLYNKVDCYCISLHATKNLPVGECGLIVHHKKYTEKIKNYISFGINSHKQLVCDGLNGKVSEYTCAIGLSLLHKIGPYLDGRRSRTAYMKASLGPGQRTLPSLEETVYSSFPVYFENEEEAKSKLALLKQNNIEALQYYQPLDNSSNSNRLFRTSVCLPCHSSVSQENLNKMVEIINA